MTCCSVIKIYALATLAVMSALSPSYGSAAVKDPPRSLVVTPPLPPERPSDLTPPKPSEIAISPSTSAPPAAEAQCASLKDSDEVLGDFVAPVIAPGACGIASPIRLSAIRLPDGGSVEVRPPALMRCSLAAALAGWVRQDLAPAATRAGQKLTAIEEAGAYECRSRDRIVGAKLSEHSKGNAMDIRALDSSTGPFFVIAQNPQGALARDVRDSACVRFATVLGPGADAYHADNVHLDLETRRHSGHFCQWTLQ